MKKKILFIINNLHVGGAEKALISLLQVFDYNRYQVDLYLFRKEGFLLNQLPKEVKILKASENFKYFDMSIKKAIFENIKKRNFKLIYYRMLSGLIYKFNKEASVKEQKAWKYLKHVIPALPNKYDTAIGFLEKTPNYFCIDKVEALKKIGYIHNDYLELKMDASIDEPYFNKFDEIITVSKVCKTSLENTFPSLINKFKIIYNIVSSQTIQKLALEEIDFPKKGIRLLSIGRLNEQKAYDIAIEACRILIEKGLDIYWYILGEGTKRAYLENLINEYNLQNRFILLGLKDNPYAYLKNADIFVHTARFEGFGIVVQEAKIMNKPIVLTNFNTANSLIKDGYNGIITEMNPEKVAQSLEKIINNKELRQELSNNLATTNYGTEDEIKKLYKIIENE